MNTLMIRIYLLVATEAQNSVETVKSGIAWAEMLERVNIGVDILVSIVVAAGGIWGYRYIRNLREKQREATFSYLMRLNVRLKYFHDTLASYPDEIMERFLPRNKRRGSSTDNTVLVEDMIKRLAKNAGETLEFLRNENNQMPAQRGWIEKFNRFVEFLLDFEQIGEEGYFKWVDDGEWENSYYSEITKIIDELLKMALDRQVKLEKKMFRWFL